MKEWTFILADIVGLFIVILILKTFFSMFGEKRWNKIWIEIIADSVFLGLGTVINVYKINQIVFAVFFYLLMLSYSFLYKIKPLRRIYSSILSYIILIVSEMLMGLLLSSITKMTVEQSLKNIVYYINVSIVSKLAMYIIIRLISSYVVCKTKYIPKIAMLTFLILPITTFVILYFMSEFIYNSDDRTSQTISFVLSLLLIFSNIVVFFMLDFVAKQKDKEMQVATKTQQLECEKQYYNELYNKQVINDKQTHDIKNKIFAIKHLLKEDPIKAEKELENLTNAFNSVAVMKITGVSGIDALLNNKLANAKSNGIKTEIECIIGKIENIDIIDLCVVLGNLIDNSIEACLKIQNIEDRFIKISIKQEKNVLQLKIINSQIKQQFAGQTSKKDKIHHGFGMQNVKEIIDKYNGYYVIDENATTYIVVVGMGNKND